MRRDEPFLIDIFAVEPSTIESPEIVRGTPVAVVSEDVSTGGQTLLARLPAGWQGSEPADDGTLEVFVLEGELNVDGRTLHAAGFASVPQSSGGAELESAPGAVALLFWSPTLPVDPGAGVATRSAWDVPWEVTVLEGFPHGFMHKSLRLPDESGLRAHGAAGGFIRLVLPAPGWISPNQERHPDCWEENIMLRGDMLMPGRGRIGPGMNLANPDGHWHGPMATKGGALFLVHCDAPMGVDYRPYEPGPGELHEYLDTAPWS
jgi:hypothetical protein